MADSERFLIDNAIQRASDQAQAVLQGFLERFPRKVDNVVDFDTPEEIARRALRITRRPDF